MAKKPDLKIEQGDKCIRCGQPKERLTIAEMKTEHCPHCSAISHARRERRRLDVFRSDLERDADTLLAHAGAAPIFIRESKAPGMIEEINRFDTLATGSYYLFGHKGVGKTLRAVALMRRRLMAGSHMVGDVKYVPEIVFVTAGHMMAEFRGAMTGTHPTHSELALLRKFACADLLVIDDLGSEKDTPTTASAMFNVIDARYSHERQTIITSNLNLTELEARADRVVSRITAMCQYVQMVGEDRRLSAATARVKGEA